MLKVSFPYFFKNLNTIWIFSFLTIGPKFEGYQQNTNKICLTKSFKRFYDKTFSALYLFQSITLKYKFCDTSFLIYLIFCYTYQMEYIHFSD